MHALQPVPPLKPVRAVAGPAPASTTTPAPSANTINTAQPNDHQPWHKSRGWQLAKRGLTVGFFLLVIGLLLQQARSIDWPAVSGALGNFGWPTLMAAALLATLSHGLYACYELVGRHLTGHRVPRWRAAMIGGVSYAFNLNLGSLVGGLALRYRLYARAGLTATKTGQVIAASIVTNWLGYLTLAGALFVWQPLALPPGWGIGDSTLRWAGAGMLAVAATYLGACTLTRQRRWTWRGHRVVTPTARLAWLQLVVSVLNWLTMSAIVWIVLERQVGLPSVALVLLLAAVAGVITHVPGNLGVLEAVFVALLGQQLPASQLLAGLIVYRALYYLLPLAGASGMLWWLERRAPAVP